jgi:polyhydroxybutyrate depolymerase
MKKSLFSSILIIMGFISQAQLFSFEFEGIERTYMVHLPTGYNPDIPYPIIFNLHGLGSSALEQQLYTGFDLVADTAGIIMVYPNGVDNQWNVIGSSGANDVGFISALIDTMASAYNIDQTRIYSTGMSMGGFMSYRLACELENRIAAIASVTGLLVTNPCAPSRPMPILQMHGTDDAVVPYQGVPITISFWTIYNNCPEEPVVTELPDIDTTDNSTVTVSYYGLCNDSTEVILYTINGGEHTWPGALINIGVTNHDINGCVEIWKFFKRHTNESVLGIPEDETSDCRLTLYPNPFSDYTTVQISGPESPNCTFRIFDINGRMVREWRNSGKKRFLLERGELLSGIYFIEMTGKNERASSSFIIR